MNRPDPTDWANKRKAAVERAKQLKDERKKGAGMDETEHTFTPQINTRPSYLNKTNDSLDMLASSSQKYSTSNDDVFEQPLPGNRALHINNRNEERENVRSVPSPTSDALGNEMKRFPQRGTSSSTQSSSVSSKSFRDLPEDTIDTYTSNERHGSLGSRQLQQQQQQQQQQQSTQSSKQFQSADLYKQHLTGQSVVAQAQYGGGNRDILESSLSRNIPQGYESPRPSSSASSRPLSSTQRPSSSYSRNNGIDQNLLRGNDSLQQNILQGNVLHGNLLSPRAGQHQIDLLSPRTVSYGSTYSGSSGNILSGNSSTGNIPRDILEDIGVGDFESRLRQDPSYTSSSGPGWNDDVSIMTGYKSPGVHRQTAVLSSSSSAHQIGASTSTSAAHHTYGSTNAKFSTGAGIGIGSGSRRGSGVGAGLGVGSGIGIGTGVGSRTGSMTGTGTGVGTGTGRKGSAVLSSTTLPEWNNCSDIPNDMALALDFTSRTSPRSKSDFSDDSGSRKVTKDGLSVTQARSRLSLLKSKMRRSESGGGVRGTRLEWSDSQGLLGDNISSQVPKSAPHSRRDGDYSSTVSDASDMFPKGPKKTFASTSGDMRSQLNNNNNNSYNNSNSGNTVNRFNDYDDFSGSGNGSRNGVFNSDGKNSIIDKNGNHRKNLFNDDGNENKNKNQNTSNSVILTRGFGSEYPDNYIPPDEIDPPKSSIKYPERKNSSRSVTATIGHGNARETVNSNPSSSSSSKNNFNINGFKNNDDNRKFERSSNDEYDDDYDLNVEEKPKNSNKNNSSSSSNNYNNNNISRESRQNSRKTEKFSDNSDAYTNSRSNTVIENDTDLGELRECPSCSRKFNPKPYEKHILVCAKINSKRKVFDSLKMRVEGNPELAQILNKKMKEESKKKAIENRKSVKIGGGGGGGGERGELGGQSFRPGQAQEHDPYSRERGGGDRDDRRGSDRGGGGGGGGGYDRDGGMQAELAQHTAASAAASKKSKWQAESNAFRASMRAARQVTHAIATGAPLPPPVASAPDPSLVQCPHCSRRFNAKAADRHIPVCTNIRAKPTMLKRGLGGGGGVNGTLAATRSITSGANRKGKIM